MLQLITKVLTNTADFCYKKGLAAIVFKKSYQSKLLNRLNN
jgi:hypothetical protein